MDNAGYDPTTQRCKRRAFLITPAAQNKKLEDYCVLGKILPKTLLLRFHLSGTYPEEAGAAYVQPSHC